MSTPVAVPGSVRRYVFSTDHKVIGLQYFFLSLFAVVCGILLSLVMRYHLVNPDAKVRWFGALWPDGAPGGVMTPELYLSLMTMHGTLMVFFVLTTAPQSAFGNYFLPLQIGAEDMAFPVLNMLSFWLTALSLAVMLGAFLVEGGAPLSGWTAYPPLSALGPVTGPGQGAGQTLWLVSIGIFSVASLLGSINFITTVIDLRVTGMSMMRLPLTTWGWFLTAIISLLAFSVLLAAAILLLLDRLAGTSFYIPEGLLVSDQIQDRKGGSPLLWQHLFWFFGHPEVYIAILPGMGVVSHVLSVFSRKPVFGYRAMVLASSTIAFLGFLVWGHHMFQSGMNPYSVFAFSLLTMVIGVPSAVKTFNWLGTVWGGQIRFSTSMLFALGFVSVFVTGGLSGLIIGQPALDTYFHDTYFIVAHFHIIMGVASLLAIFSATFYWFPRMFGRMLNETLGRIHFYLTYLGAFMIFIPMHFLGMAGTPRRYPDFASFEFTVPLTTLHIGITHAAYFTAGVQVLFFINLFWSMWKGPQAVANPWESTSLEWTSHVEAVHHGPYEYSVPGAPRDFIMQADPSGKQ
jgi:cytochrome c oxidase subunit 1